jgi:hypothetical protein
MDDPTPLLFPLKPEDDDQAYVELTEELARSMAELLIQVFSVQGGVNDDD